MWSECACLMTLMVRCPSGLSKCCEVTTSLGSFLGVAIMLGLGKLVAGIF